MPRSFWQTFFASRWFLIGGVVILVFLVISGSRAIYQNYQINQEIKQLQMETERLQAKRLETLNLLNYVQSSTFVQDKARTELNLLQPGEKMAVIPNKNQTAPKITGQEELGLVQSPESVSNPAKWWRYFFGK
jgi:cell division protein FtsB